MNLKIFVRKAGTFCKSPSVLLIKFWHLLEPVVSDKLYLRVLFRIKVGYWPDLDNPRTFNEKIQWLKLYDRHPEYTRMVDKVAAKDYVEGIIGKEYIIPTIGIWNSVDEIEWNKLPEKFVIKAANDSGGIVICRDKTKLDIDEAKRTLYGLGKRDYPKYNKEYPYHGVPHRFITEQMLENGADDDLHDYKFFCFNGKAEFFKIDFGRFVDHHANYYDRDGVLQPFGEEGYPPVFDKNLNIPDNLEQMEYIADTLASSIGSPFVRIDLYNVNRHIYFGEITFFPASGMGRFIPQEWDRKLGSFMTLHTNNKK